MFASMGEYLVGNGALPVTRNSVHMSPALCRLLLIGRAAAGLVRAVGLWSWRIGVREILLHATSGIAVERSGRTISRLVFEAVGQSHVARVR